MTGNCLRTLLIRQSINISRLMRCLLGKICKQYFVVWNINKRKRKIMNKQKWHSAFLKAFFTNRWSAPVPSITHWLRAKMPAATFKQSTTGRCEFVKNAFKKCSCCHFCLFMIFLFLLFISHTTEHYSNLHIENVCFTVLTIIISVCHYIN